MSTVRIERAFRRPKRTPELWDGAHLRTALDIVFTSLDQLRRLGCGLTGHTMVRHFEPQRMALRCINCGEQTHGWTIYAPLTPSQSH